MSKQNNQLFGSFAKNKGNKQLLIIILIVALITAGTCIYSWYLKQVAQFNLAKTTIEQRIIIAQSHIIGLEKQVENLRDKVGFAREEVNCLQEQVELLGAESLGIRDLIEDKKATNISAGKEKSPLVKLMTTDDCRFIYYRGSVIVSGEYKAFSPTAVFVGGQLCFYADEETGYLIPRENGDERNPWFCFNNPEKAKKMLGIDSGKIFSDEKVAYVYGKATVKISNYVVDKKESEVWDTADLDEVISKEKYIIEYIQE